MDIEFGPDGSLYVIDWGTGFGGNNLDSGIYRIDYVVGARRPVATATATPDSGPTPLDVQFSSTGSNDPDGTAITYSWNFGDGTTSTEANPQHTLRHGRHVQRRADVTDEAGQTGTDTVQVVAGNTRPTVELVIPEDGQFADFGETVPYEVRVTDPEDGTIDCNRVTLTIQLGHDDHAHGLGQQTGCSGTFQTETDGGHGANANIFTSLVVTYTDGGSGGAGALTGRDEAVLQPKTKQVEFYERTGRVAGSTSTGDPGVQKETTSDTGGGQNIGFIESGDYVSYAPTNLKDIRELRFRVASGGDGGNIEVRLDSPTGQRRRHEPDDHEHGRLAELDDDRDADRSTAGGHARAVLRVHAPDLDRRAVQPQLVPRGRQGCGGQRAARGLRDGNAQRRHGAARRHVRRHGDRRRLAEPDLPLGLRRVRHHRRHVDGAGPDVHVRAGRDVHGALHGHRSAGRQLDGDRPGDGHQRWPVPAGQPALGRVRGQRAERGPVDGVAAGCRAPVQRGQRAAEPADRQRLDVRARDDGREPDRPGAARGRLGGHGQGRGRRAQPELPAGRPACVEQRRQLGVGAHDLGGRQPGLRVHLRRQREPAERGRRQARRHPGHRPARVLRAAALGRDDAAGVLLLSTATRSPRSAATRR